MTDFEIYDENPDHDNLDEVRPVIVEADFEYMIEMDVSREGKVLRAIQRIIRGDHRSDRGDE